LVLPGFLFGSKPYLGLVNSLRHRGYAAEVVPLRPSDWWPTLLGSDFQWYLRLIDSSLHDIYKKHGSVALVGHSAGGWVARILLACESKDKDVPYQGQLFPGRRKKVHSLVTLGTPHASIEAYPFGRKVEKLIIDPVLLNRNSRGESGRRVVVAETVRGSSLQFANYFYPDASSLPGVQVVCLVGDAITGVPPPWRKEYLPTTDDNVEYNPGKQQMEIAAKVTMKDKWLAYEGYKSGCGDGAVAGDGVTPISIAHLPFAAENLVLPGVWHGPQSSPERPWYGDEAILDTWVKYLDAGYSAP
jgi:hypothetical protein